jgi:hypothetical protein
MGDVTLWTLIPLGVCIFAILACPAAHEPCDYDNPYRLDVLEKEK